MSIMDILSTRALRIPPLRNPRRRFAFETAKRSSETFYAARARRLNKMVQTAMCWFPGRCRYSSRASACVPTIAAKARLSEWNGLKQSRPPRLAATKPRRIPRCDSQRPSQSITNRSIERLARASWEGPRRTRRSCARGVVSPRQCRAEWRCRRRDAPSCKIELRHH